MRKSLLTIVALAGAAFAQEPSQPIRGQAPISAVQAAPSAAATGDAKKAPVLPPVPLPYLKPSLAEVARRYRIEHMRAPRAVKIFNDETFDAGEKK